MANELFLVIYNLIKLLKKAKSSENLYIQEERIYNNPIVTYEVFILGEEDSPVKVAVVCYN